MLIGHECPDGAHATARARKGKREPRARNELRWPTLEAPNTVCIGLGVILLDKLDLTRRQPMLRLSKLVRTYQSWHGTADAIVEQPYPDKICDQDRKRQPAQQREAPHRHAHHLLGSIQKLRTSPHARTVPIPLICFSPTIVSPVPDINATRRWAQSGRGTPLRPAHNAHTPQDLR